MKISIHTNINDLNNVFTKLNEIGDVSINTNFSKLSLLKDSKDAEIIFTNPNSLKFKYDEKFICNCKKLKTIVTASTGTNHIDENYLKKKKINLISLKNKKNYMKKITATAEHALLLTLALSRNFSQALDNVKAYSWDWSNCIGYQLSEKKFGIIGMGRLGEIYAKYVSAISKNILYYDPNVNIKKYKKTTLKYLIKNSDIISIHIHSSKKNLNFINTDFLHLAKKNLILINTSRGDIVDEDAIINFIKNNKSFRYGTDVIKDEFGNIKKSKILKNKSKQILITPHIGGMTYESRKLAYTFAVKLLFQRYGIKY